MNPLVLALLALVPVATATAGTVLLTHDPRAGRSYRLDSALAGENAVERALGRIGRLLLRPLPRTAARVQSVFRTWLLNSGGDGRTARRVLELSVGLAGVAVTVAMVLALTGRIELAVLVLLVGTLLRPLRLSMAASRRQQQIERAAPATLELLAVLITAGLTFRHALSRVSERAHGPLGDELDTLLLQMEIGWSPEQAVAALTDRCSAPTIVRMALSARQSMELGSPIAEALTSLADDARTNYVVTLRTRAERNVVKGTAALIVLTMPAFAVLTLVVLGAAGYEQVVEGLGGLGQ